MNTERYLTAPALPRRSYRSSDIDLESFFLIPEHLPVFPPELSLNIEQFIELSDEVLPMMIQKLNLDPKQRFCLVDIPQEDIILHQHTFKPSLTISYLQQPERGHWRLESVFRNTDTWVQELQSARKNGVSDMALHYALYRDLNNHLCATFPSVYARQFKPLPPVIEEEVLNDGSVEYRVVKPLYASDFRLYPNELLGQLAKYMSFLLDAGNFSSHLGMNTPENETTLRNTIQRLRNFRENSLLSQSG